LAPGCPELTEISRPATCPDKVCIKLALGLFSIVAAETFTCEIDFFLQQFHNPYYYLAWDFSI
jgi:hypothetical protein